MHPLLPPSLPSDPWPSLCLCQAFQGEWEWGTSGFMWKSPFSGGSGEQLSLQVTDYTFDLLHNPYQAHGA